jgi:lipopolysaccharide biosynthesis regulator YciM
MYELLLLLLPVAAASGWFIGRRYTQGSSSRNSRANFSRDYFIGLNYLLNEQPDKAVDVFIKVLEVDSETVETHLALGHLFRRRGEVDRAIRIHQNLIARPSLAKKHKVEALVALGRDYQRAGVLDRAERLFLQVVESGENAPKSLRYLLEIYQQQKNWQATIVTARKYEAVTRESLSTDIAHYYCELAIIARTKKDDALARSHLKEAVIIDSSCVRASLLLGEIESAAGQWKPAIRAYKQVQHQDPEYLSETLMPLVSCYEQLQEEPELMDYLWQCLKDYPRMSTALVIADRLQKTQSDAIAIEFLEAQLKKQSSLRGMKRLIQLHLLNAETQARENLMMLQDLTKSLLKNKPIYRCRQCGFNGGVLYWQCPGCKSWSTVKPIHGVEGD